MQKTRGKRGCLAVAGILFLLFFLLFRNTEKAELLETEGRSFEKAEVVRIIQDNETENGNIVGSQIVELKLLRRTERCCGRSKQFCQLSVRCSL